MPYKGLNDKAADSFERLKELKGWTRKSIEAAKAGKDIDIGKVEKILDSLPTRRVEITEKVYHINDKVDSAVVETLDFIDSLGLPADLSIAIACIIAYGQKRDKGKLQDAIRYIEGEIKDA